jgi:predicted nucleic acid-binding protein
LSLKGGYSASKRFKYYKVCNVIMPLVCDASTLILLQKIGLLEKLGKHPDFTITEHVYQEAIKRGKEKGFADAYALEKHMDSSLIRKKQPKSTEQVTTLMKQFGTAKGETETLALCMELQNSTAAVDDRKAMAICNAYNIPFVTSLTLAITAHKSGVITKKTAEEMILQLGNYGRYKNELIHEALKTIRGEQP